MNLNQDYLKIAFRFGLENAMPRISATKPSGTIFFIWGEEKHGEKMLDIFFREDGAVTFAKFHGDDDIVRGTVMSAAELTALLNWVTTPTVPVPVPGEGDGTNG